MALPVFIPQLGALGEPANPPALVEPQYATPGSAKVPALDTISCVRTNSFKGSAIGPMFYNISITGIPSTNIFHGHQEFSGPVEVFYGLGTIGIYYDGTDWDESLPATPDADNWGNYPGPYPGNAPNRTPGDFMALTNALGVIGTYDFKGDKSDPYTVGDLDVALDGGSGSGAKVAAIVAANGQFFGPRGAYGGLDGFGVGNFPCGTGYKVGDVLTIHGGSATITVTGLMTFGYPAFGMTALVYGTPPNRTQQLTVAMNTELVSVGWGKESNLSDGSMWPDVMSPVTTLPFVWWPGENEDDPPPIPQELDFTGTSVTITRIAKTRTPYYPGQAADTVTAPAVEPYTISSSSNSITYGDSVTLAATFKALIASVTITNAGSGYTSAPDISFSGGGGTGAAGTVILDDFNNVIGVQLTNPGYGYTSAPSVSFSGGGGSGLAGTAVLGYPAGTITFYGQGGVSTTTGSQGGGGGGSLMPSGEIGATTIDQTTGLATLSTDFYGDDIILPGGSLLIWAVASGMSSVYIINSPNITITVAQVTPTVNLTLDNTSVVYGAGCTMTAVLDTVNDYPDIASGLCRFLADSLDAAPPQDLGTASVLSDGNATASATVWLPAGSHSLQTDYLGDTNYNPARSSTQNLTVTKALLTIIPDDQTMVYGSPMPTLTYTAGYFPPGLFLLQDTYASSVTGLPAVTSSGTQTSDVGTYDINASSGTMKSQNYTFAFDSGTLTISPAPLYVTAYDVFMQQGQPMPTLNGLIVGLVNGDTITFRGSCGAGSSSSPGDYPITAGVNDPDGKIGNYTVTYGNGTLTILAANS